MPSKVGTTTSAPRSGIESGDQAVDQGGIDLRHVAEADDGAVGLRRHGGDAGLERGAEPLGEVRIVHETHRQAGERRLDLLALVAGHDDDRLGARGQRRLGGDAHQRPAADLGESLFGPPMRVERPAASTTAAMRRPRAAGGSCARLRPGDDLHQQAADPHAGDCLGAARQVRRATA